MRDKKYYIALDDFEWRVVVKLLKRNAEQPIAKASTPMRWTRFY